jgi:hypothetical protein
MSAGNYAAAHAATPAHSPLQTAMEGPQHNGPLAICRSALKVERISLQNGVHRLPINADVSAGFGVLQYYLEKKKQPTLLYNLQDSQP